jgi:hypothetical protein
VAVARTPANFNFAVPFTTDGAAVPVVPPPTPVAVKIMPIVLLAAPMAVKSVSPTTTIVYSVVGTNDPVVVITLAWVGAVYASVVPAVVTV